jgi:hypothetical protein
MFLMFLTFLFTTAIYGSVLWLACRRISRHLQGNPEGVKAVTQHVLIPLLGRPPEVECEPAGEETEAPYTRNGAKSAPAKAGDSNG